MRFPWFGTDPDATETWLTVTLVDNRTFTGKVEGWYGKVFIGTQFVRIDKGNDEVMVYPLHRVKEVRYFERKKSDE
ncbi:hypothetical protein LCGC14_3125020 [marine sediment metagenome]|uniref:Uncharacterized protein n=1 Tax=marine sediment metagenome TaxID=412755 RepID=A0A0F8Y8M4_9ZZZZ